MEYNATPTQPQNGLTVAELFCGGGLMAVGLKESGFSLVWANDFDKRAVQAYRHNLGDHVVHADITTINPVDIPDVDVIAGGPPCQDYSVAGKGEGEAGERGKLVWAYLTIIREKQPKAFIFENVKGLIGKKHRHTFDALLERFDEIGYTVSWQLINAWDYGVAQKRERVFIVGIRKDLGFSFAFPEPDPEDVRTQVLRDVIGDLPEPGEKPENHRGGALNNFEKEFASKIPIGGNWRSLSKDDQLNFWNGKEQTGKTTTLKRFTWDEPMVTVLTSIPSSKMSSYLHPGIPANHDRYPQRKLGGRREERTPVTWDDPARTLCVGGGYDKNGKFGGVSSPVPEQFANHDEKSYWTPKSDYTYDQANRVQSMDKASATIPAHHNSGQPIHPTQAPRRFTVRECLRIQSVPDWYVLPDDISLSAQYRIVGNGVASRVAWYLGRALGEQLNQKKNRPALRA